MNEGKLVQQQRLLSNYENIPAQYTFLTNKDTRKTYFYCHLTYYYLSSKHSGISTGESFLFLLCYVYLHVLSEFFYLRCLFSSLFVLLPRQLNNPFPCRLCALPINAPLLISARAPIRRKTVIHFSALTFLSE